jgi:radical SAM superfamily enzyme YgiQ (UPF0313 family)
MPCQSIVLFLQLPQLDTDVAGPHENVMLAAAYLQFAAERAGEGRYYRFARLPGHTQEMDNAHLLDSVEACRPDIVAFTVYLWNVERTLRIAAMIRKRMPAARFVAGGPEVAFPHPFLFRPRVLDVAVAGEGEDVFPQILRYFRGGKLPDLRTVACLTPQGYKIGTRPAPAVELPKAIPPPGYPACAPDARGMAYVETSRGCPFRCTYCRYPQMRRRMSFLEPGDVLKRIAGLRDKGAREIRFVDPSFNSHPRFDELLRGLVSLNRSGSLEFFAEINVERLDSEHARLLARANFKDIEVGMQTRDPSVLRAVRRPANPARLDAGIRNLTRNGIRVTLDVMYGLPLQTNHEVHASLRHAAGFRGVNVQSLQTLLLPGTELRRRRREWTMRAAPLPPYGVTATSTLSARDLHELEAYISRHPRLRSDLPTSVFVARRLPALFREQVRVLVDRLDPDAPVAGYSSRRAVRISGDSFFEHRERLARFAAAAIRRDPDMLWQFILELRREEPLDLLDGLIAVIRRCPRHLIDRYAAPARDGRIASRRILVRVADGGRIPAAWIRDAEQTLRQAFF